MIAWPANSQLVSFSTKPVHQRPPRPTRYYPEILDAQEPPDERTNSSTSIALCRFAWVHLPAVAITLTLLGLYVAKIRWGRPRSEVLNALQFAAKTHEILILLSLTDMLLHRITSSLQDEDIGLPLGFLPSAFYLGAPVRYLLSRKLWAPIVQSSDKCRSHGLTGVMIIIVAVLSVGASPFSAIAMIPRQGWWKSHEPFYTNTIQVNSTIYSTNLGAEMGPKLNTSSSIDDIPLQWNVLQSLPTVSLGTTWNTMFPYTNITYTNYGALYRPISIADVAGTAVATCPMSYLTELLEKRTRQPSSSDHWLVKAERKTSNSSALKKWKQPLLAVKCDQSVLNESTASFDINSMTINESIHLEAKHYPSLQHSAENAGSSYGLVDHRYLNLRDAMALPISTDVLFSAVVNETKRNAWPASSPSLSFCLCVVSARWVEADVWVEHPRSDDPFLHLSYTNGQAQAVIEDSFGVGELIQIDRGWMDDITSLSNGSLYGEFTRICMEHNRLSLPCLQKILALHYIDAIAELGRLEPVELDPAESIDPTKDILHLTKHLYTYAYEFRDSRSIPVAFSILLLHVLMVLIQLATIIRSKDPWRGSSWESFGDMLLLALRSKAPDGLKDEGGEQTSAKTWAKTVIVRRAGDEERSRIFMRDHDTTKGSLEG
ncbi:hypothetical protein F66182_541 [Fusarium sp. NRRL 66182]|nr:hypothetical protein F66182_541 [Fusarium sp. NRRL 66182]